MLRAKGVVGRFVEYYGPGLASLSLADRATLANMAPEYGATCGFFGIDDKTLDYLRLTGREEDQIALVEAYAKEQGFWIDPGAADPIFTDTLELDMGTVVPSLAGPKRPQDKVALTEVDDVFNADLAERLQEGQSRVAGRRQGPRHRRRRRGHRGDHQLHQHLEPRRDGRRRPRRQEGERARAQAQALGQDQPRARHAGGHRLSRQGRPAISTSMRSASTWSAMAAPPASAIPGPLAEPISAAINEQQHRRRLGDLGQPQLRGPRLARRARQLPRQPAAGRRLCAQGHGDRGLHHHPDRQGQRRRGRLS